MAFPLKCQQIRGLFLHSWTRPNHRNMIKYGWIQLYHHFIPCICIYIYIYIIYIYIYVYLYLYNIHDPTLFLVLHPFPGIRFFFPSRCFAPGIPGIRGLRFSQEDVLRLPQRSGAEGRILAEMAHLCGGFAMIYRTFWLLKMVMFHI